MQATATPRLSEAKTLLPLLRAKLASAAAARTLPVDVSVGLLPLVEDGLFGYEIVPNRQARTYLTVGWSGLGQAVLRRTSASTEPPALLRLATVDGKLASDARPRARGSAHHRETFFADVSDAAEAAFAALSSLYPGSPRKPIELAVDVHRYLDEALVTAHRHLAEWDPYIEFFGLPNEAQFGFALSAERGERGELVCQRPDMWVLRWRTPSGAIYHEWSIALRDVAAGSVSAPR